MLLGPCGEIVFSGVREHRYGYLGAVLVENTDVLMALKHEYWTQRGITGQAVTREFAVANNLSEPLALGAFQQGIEKNTNRLMRVASFSLGAEMEPGVVEGLNAIADLPLPSAAVHWLNPYFAGRMISELHHAHARAPHAA
jgi:hypothetical protein